MKILVAFMCLYVLFALAATVGCIAVGDHANAARCFTWAGINGALLWLLVQILREDRKRP